MIFPPLPIDGLVELLGDVEAVDHRPGVGQQAPAGGVQRRPHVRPVRPHLPPLPLRQSFQALPAGRLIPPRGHGQGHGFEVSWPLPSRVRCDHCRREDKAYLEYKNGVQVVRDLDLWGQPSFWVYQPAYHRCPWCHHRQALLPRAIAPPKPC